MDADKKLVVKKALLALAGHCDYAESLDDMGFNRMDTAFGHALAETAMGAGDLTDHQYAAALKMMQKYRKQLSRYGIDLPENEIESKPDALVMVGNGQVFVAFSDVPSFKTRATLKLWGARWNPDLAGKPWVLKNEPGVAEKCAELVGAPITMLEPEKPKIPTGNGRVSGTPAVKISDSKVPEKPQIPTGNGKNFMEIDRTNGDLILTFPASFGRKERVAQAREIVGGEWKWKPTNDGTPWPCTVPSRFLVSLLAAFPDAVMTEAAKDLFVQMVKLEVLSDKVSGEVVDIPGLTGTPFPFQQVGFQFLENAKGRALIADEMGLGKTIQTIMFLQAHPELRPALVVVPKSVLINWQREIAKWMTSKNSTYLIRGKSPFALDAAGADILIINWDILSVWEPEILKIKPAILIGDEAHAIKNWTGEKSKGSPARAKAFIRLASQIERVILLTGTPVTNRPRELYPLLHCIDPKSWPSFWKYAHRYCDAHQTRFGWDFDGASNLQELHRVIKPYVVRREKRDVLKDLPSKRRVNIIVDFDAAVRAEYNDHIQEALAHYSPNNPALALVELNAAKQACITGKLPACIDWIEEFLETGQKLVVFGWHIATIETVFRHFGEKAVMIHGQVSDRKRQEAIDRFQTDDSVRLLVGNIQAAGVGITLTAASNAAFLEYAWTPGDMDQAEARVHRIGQELPVTIWHLIADDTIEEDIVDLLDKKQEVIDIINTGQDGSEGFGMMNALVGRIKARQEKEAKNGNTL